MKSHDFYDLNYQSLVEELYPGELGLIIDNASLWSIIPKVIRLTFSAIKQIITSKKKNILNVNIDTVVVLFSLNQYRALESLINAIPNVLVISTFSIKSKNNLIVNTRGNSWVSLLQLPGLMLNMLKQKGFKYRSMVFHFDDYLNTPGVYTTAEKYLKQIKPKTLLLANDHMFFTRSYFRAAQKENIKTVYTQHASVSAFFPDLEFDYAFLDGEETLYKYTGNGKSYSSNIFLSGSPRFDKIPKIPEVNTHLLGIAINSIDNRQKVLSFTNILLTNNINFALRPHPGQTDLDFWENYCKVNSITYSNPFIDNPITFIASCSRFVVGDSALHLEVALCKKVSYYLNFQDGKISDSYSYIKEGLVRIKTEKEIVDLLLNGDEHSGICEDKIRYYVANYATKYWGKSTDLLKDTISEINEQKKLSNWTLRKGEEKIFEIKK